MENLINQDPVMMNFPSPSQAFFFLATQNCAK
jgi:hypothetical protein